MKERKTIEDQLKILHSYPPETPLFVCVCVMCIVFACGMSTNMFLHLKVHTMSPIRRQVGTMCHPLSLPISLFESGPLTEPGSPQPSKAGWPTSPQAPVLEQDKLPCGLMT